MKPISDEDLLGRQFRYDDPEGIAGLCKDRPDEALEPEIIGYYQLRPSGGRIANPDAPFIWCCHCQKPTHWDGRVLRDNSEKTYIIGADCGRLHYGDKFIAIDRMFGERIARQSLLERWSRVLQLREQMLSELAGVFRDPIWQSIDLKRQELHRLAPDLVFRLTPVAKRGGNLIVRERVRDLAGEERRLRSYERAKARFKALPKVEQARERREGLAPERENQPLYRNTEENLGPLRGKHAITDDGDVRSWAIRLRDLLARVEPIDQLKGKKNTQLSSVLRAIRESGQGLVQAFQETSAAWRFFEPTHLAAIERWYGSINPSNFPKGNGVGSSLSTIAPLAPQDYFLPPTLGGLIRLEDIGSLAGAGA